MKTIILNHKCYLSYDEVREYKNVLENIKPNNINLVVMPNIAYLSLFKESNLELGAQNFYSYNYGAYTGEVSLEILKSMNTHYTLVGHPERIILRLDSYEQIKDKFFRSLNSNFKTILCIGHDQNMNTIKKELKYYLKGIEYDTFKNLIIAYEPANNIEGTSVNLKEIVYVCDFVKSYIKKKYGESVSFIYGGAINKENVKEVLDITDGVIIGKSSISINEIKEILFKVKEIS